VVVVIDPGFFDNEGEDIDWGEGSDEPIVADCSLEDPELCDSCQ
jgi:hypothetical protein